MQARNNYFNAVSAVAYDLRRTAGYLVADNRGRVVGRVECPMYGTAPDVPDALAVRGGFLSRRRRLVPADAIEQIDGQSGVIGLRVERENIRSFLWASPAVAAGARPLARDAAETTTRCLSSTSRSAVSQAPPSAAAEPLI